MPNHIINNVRISGKAEDVKECFDAIIKPVEYEDYEGVKHTEERFSFEHVIPMPKSLHIESSTRVDDGIKLIAGPAEEREKVIAKYRSWYDSEDERKAEIDKIMELGKTALENIKLYGHKDWYDWSIENWGTKWNCYENSYEYNGGEVLELSFQTAWSTPIPIFDKLAEMYPELEIYVEYADEDWGNNCGTITYEGGTQTEWNGGDLDFAMELWGYTPEEIEEEKRAWAEEEAEEDEEE